MPAFDTPEPIIAEIDLVAGSLQITASDCADTVVEVRPRDPEKDADVRAAERIQVGFDGARLTVATQHGSSLGRMLQKGMVDVIIELPLDSRVRADADYANIRSEGRLGTSRITTSAGNITLDRVTGNAELTSGHGRIRAQTIDGAAAIKTTTGAITVGTVTGRLRMVSGHGDVSAEHALDSVEARTAHGGILIGEVVRGTVDLQSSYGELEIGIREGTAAWLDASSKHGTVHSALEEADRPDPSGDTVEVHARAGFGDVVVRRV